MGYECMKQESAKEIDNSISNEHFSQNNFTNKTTTS